MAGQIKKKRSKSRSRSKSRPSRSRMRSKSSKSRSKSVKSKSGLGNSRPSSKSGKRSRKSLRSKSRGISSDGDGSSKASSKRTNKTRKSKKGKKGKRSKSRAKSRISEPNTSRSTSTQKLTSARSTSSVTSTKKKKKGRKGIMKKPKSMVNASMGTKKSTIRNKKSKSAKSLKSQKSLKNRGAKKSQSKRLRRTKSKKSKISKPEVKVEVDKVVKRRSDEILLRNGQLANSGQLIALNDQEIIKLKKRMDFMREWLVYTACRNIPDFLQTNDMNEFLSYWTGDLQDGRHNTLEKVIKHTPDVLQLISELRQALENLPSYFPPSDYPEIEIMYRDFQERQHLFINLATYNLISNLSPETFDQELGEFDCCNTTMNPHITHCLWGNMFPQPDHKGFHFKQIDDFKFTIPKPLMETKGIYRLVKLSYDNFSDFTDSYYPPGQENLLKNSIEVWLAVKKVEVRKISIVQEKKGPTVDPSPSVESKVALNPKKSKKKLSKKRSKKKRQDSSKSSRSTVRSKKSKKSKKLEKSKSKKPKKVQKKDGKKSSLQKPQITTILSSRSTIDNSNSSGSAQIDDDKSVISDVVISALPEDKIDQIEFPPPVFTGDKMSKKSSKLTKYKGKGKKGSKKGQGASKSKSKKRIASLKKSKKSVKKSKSKVKKVKSKRILSPGWETAEESEASEIYDPVDDNQESTDKSDDWSALDIGEEISDENKAEQEEKKRMKNLRSAEILSNADKKESKDKIESKGRRKRNKDLIDEEEISEESKKSSKVSRHQQSSISKVSLISSKSLEDERKSITATVSKFKKRVKKRRKSKKGRKKGKKGRKVKGKKSRKSFKKKKSKSKIKGSKSEVSTVTTAAQSTSEIKPSEVKSIKTEVKEGGKKTGSKSTKKSRQGRLSQRLSEPSKATLKAKSGQNIMSKTKSMSSRGDQTDDDGTVKSSQTVGSEKSQDEVEEIDPEERELNEKLAKNNLVAPSRIGSSSLMTTGRLTSKPSRSTIATRKAKKGKKSSSKSSNVKKSRSKSTGGKVKKVKGKKVKSRSKTRSKSRSKSKSRNASKTTSKSTKISAKSTSSIRLSSSQSRGNISKKPKSKAKLKRPKSKRPKRSKGSKASKGSKNSKGSKKATKKRSKSSKKSIKGKKGGKKSKKLKPSKSKTNQQKLLEIERAKQLEKDEKLALFPELDPHEVNLRKYAPLGGIYDFKILVVPPQEKDRGVWFMHLVEPDSVLKNHEYKSYFAEVKEPNEEEIRQISHRVLEEKSSEAKFLEELNIKVPDHLMPHPESAEEFEEEFQKNWKEAWDRFEKGKDKSLRSLIRISMSLPRSALWFECPTPIKWSAKNRFWSNGGFHELNFDPQKLEVNFASEEFGVFALAQNRWINLPFKNWELKPCPGKNSAQLILECPKVNLQFTIEGHFVCLSGINTFGYPQDLKEIQDGLLNKFMNLPSLIKRLRSYGLDVFPEFDTQAYVGGITPKDFSTEIHLYQCMAMGSSAINFRSSDLNQKLDPEKMIYFMREQDTSPFQMTISTDQRTTYIDLQDQSQIPRINELMLNNSSPQKYSADLIHFLKNTMSPEGLVKIRESDKLFVETTRELLCAIKPLSYS